MLSLKVSYALVSCYVFNISGIGNLMTRFESLSDPYSGARKVKLIPTSVNWKQLTRTTAQSTTHSCIGVTWMAGASDIWSASRLQDTTFAFQMGFDTIYDGSDANSSIRQTS